MSNVKNEKNVGKENIDNVKKKLYSCKNATNDCTDGSCKEKRRSRGEMLALWMEKKGKTKKEHCHPLLSRKRPLSQIVGSPSFKPSRRPKPKVRHSMLLLRPQSQNKQNQQGAKRKTIHAFGHTAKFTSPKSVIPDKRERSSLTQLTAETSWKNKVLSRRERLDLWLAAKGKTPYSSTPHIKRKSLAKSPHPLLKTIHNKQESNTLGLADYSQKKDRQISKHIIESGCTDEGLEALLDSEKPIDEVKTILDALHNNNKDVVYCADYWICRARVAARENDAQRVICLLEQAYTFEAKPEEKIREEICRFLQTLETEDTEEILQNTRGSTRFCASDYAVTPGRKVHFAVADSPLDFKSSIIRFCIVESKAFKRRLNTQLRKKVMTPVRRSTRLRRSDIPDFLRQDNRLIDSPTQVENDIIDGHIGFIPNKHINTPLNKGWLIDDMTSHQDYLVDEENNLELSFM